MPRIGMKQMKMGRKLAYPTVASRTASVTAMLCVGPELAMLMITTSPMRKAPALRPRPGASGACAGAGTGSLLAGDVIALLRLGLGSLCAGSDIADPRGTPCCGAITQLRCNQVRQARGSSRSAGYGPSAPDYGKGLLRGIEHVADVLGGVHERQEEVLVLARMEQNPPQQHLLPPLGEQLLVGVALCIA